MPVTPGPASAKPADVTAPALRVPVYAGFTVGAQVGPSEAFATEDEWYKTSSIPQDLRWSATDPSGICGYDVWAMESGTYPHLLATDVRSPTFRGTSNDYDQVMPGSTILGWGVAARDCVGNSTAVVNYPYPGDTDTVSVDLGVAHEARVGGTLTQEDSRSIVYHDRALISYTGAWATRTSVAYSAGAAVQTAKSGASALVKVDIDQAGKHVALVGAAGPNHGKYAVYLDGRKVSTVDTYSATKVPRRVAWDRALPAGHHAIKLINLGTTGRPIVQLDAVLQSW
ncbi:hypothetical protein BH10ACT10_BH10ACT10_07760 [soil metagenome]